MTDRKVPRRCDDPACSACPDYGGSPARRAKAEAAWAASPASKDLPNAWPVRKCVRCGHETRSTSTLDMCLECGENGLRPQHFLTRETPTPSKTEGSPCSPGADTACRPAGPKTGATCWARCGWCADCEALGAARSSSKAHPIPLEDDLLALMSTWQRYYPERSLLFREELAAMLNRRATPKGGSTRG